MDLSRLQRVLRSGFAFDNAALAAKQSLCCASSSHRIGVAFDCLRFASALWGSCSSANGFRLAFLPTVGRPSAVGFSWCVFLSWFIHRGLEPHLVSAHDGHTQDGAEQPATAPETKPEGDQKPTKPESESRPQ